MLLLNYLNILYQKSILNTPRKKRFIFSIIVYFPIVTLLFGNPFPDLLKQIDNPYKVIDIDPILSTFIDTISTSLAVIGTISTGIFWIHRNSNNKHEETREEISNLKKDMKSIINDELENTKNLHKLEIENLKKKDDELKDDMYKIRSILMDIFKGDKKS